MPPLFLLGLAALLALLVIAGAIIFLRAAFWGERDWRKEQVHAADWRPPFLAGEALRDWASKTAERATTRELGGALRAETPNIVIAEIAAGAAQAMLPLARDAERERVLVCPKEGLGSIRLTTVEILALARDLRRHCSVAELKQIGELAAENARTISAAREDGGPATATVVCPLQGPDQICRTFAARPIHCRSVHAAAVTSITPGANALAVEQTEQKGHEHLVGEGVERGVVRALEGAGLDATRYELNSALARALQTPDAAERWARGENVFAGCLV